MHRGSRSQQAAATVVGVSPMSSTPTGPSHQIEEYWTAAVKGTRLLKFGRRGNPHMHFFRLSEDNSALQWEARNHRVRQIPLKSVTKVVKGQTTDVFIKSRSKAYRVLTELSFSLHYKSRNENRTLDLVCKDAEEFDLWYNGLRLITEDRKRGGGIVIGLADQSLGTPVPKNTPPGDCYIWGSFLDQKGGSSAEHTAVSSPQLVPASQKLDIVQVACGPQHYAAVTRSGHLYTWGTGTAGRLGLGTLQHVATPTAVSGLNDLSGVKSASCGDCSTAAILTDGTLYTWGGGLSGQLGHGNLSTQYLPRQIERGLQGIAIAKVSCGPYHTAACSENGQLFSWGDGLCGKLGHGDWESSFIPRIVESLKSEGRVVGVSCGWWHTAAVVEKSAAVESANSTKSVSLYTWGGEFSWAGDNHRGCLGNGTTTGSTTPKQVQGDLGLRHVKQVACGLNLTVALTTDGLVYQMGTTGAGAARVEWEGAKKPTRVEGRLKGCFADKVACGSRHVCVVATPIISGRIDENRRSSYLFMWGSGKNGQLGNGDKEDQSSPQLVDKLRQRRIEDISCGGDYTLAVCRYDAQLAAQAFAPHPDISSTSNNSGAYKKTSTGGTPNAAGAVTAVFGALKQKSVKHRRNEGSNVGSDVSVPKPQPKVIGVHNSARVRMERQKISETAFLAPLMAGGPSSEGHTASNDLSENGAGVHDMGELHGESQLMAGPDFQAQDYEEGESVVSGPVSEPTNNGRHGHGRYKEVRTSSEGSMTTTEGIGPLHPDSDDDETIDSRSNTRSFSNMDVPGAEEFGTNMFGDGEFNETQQQAANIDVQKLCATTYPSTSQAWARSQQLRSATRLRSRQKVLQQVLSLTESFAPSEQHPHAAGPPGHGHEQIVMESARAPRLWETGENTISENGTRGSQTTRTVVGSQVHFEECQQVPSGSSPSPVPSMVVNVMEGSGDGYHPHPRQVMQLPGHTTKHRGDNMPRLALERGTSSNVSQSIPIATAREEVMNKAAECEHMRQQLHRYADCLQAAQAKLKKAAEEQGKEANRLGMDISSVQVVLQPSQSSAHALNAQNKQSPESMTQLAEFVQQAASLVAGNPLKNARSVDIHGRDSELARENREMKALLSSLSALVGDMGNVLKIPAPTKELPPPVEAPASIPEAEEKEKETTGSGHKRIKSLDLAQSGSTALGGTETQAMNMRMEQVDEGVSVIFQTTDNVTKIKKIRFSKRLFTAGHAQEWWERNQSRLIRDYGLVPGHMLGENNPLGKHNTDSDLMDKGSSDVMSLMGSVAMANDRDSLSVADESIRYNTRRRRHSTTDPITDSPLDNGDLLSRRLAKLRKDEANG